jgi:S1-C subfamily serine protease
VIAPGYVVTNAHVVVGADSVIVQTSDSSFDATPVLVDLDLDIAVLWADGLKAAPLTFTGAEPRRGALGATVGYPGGGNESVEPATVAASYFATGLDVTQQSRVTRRIVELRSKVIPGDSGGPLILEDGTIGGVVFAESRVDPTVGYALSPLQVFDRVAPAVGLKKAVATGPCVK